MYKINKELSKEIKSNNFCFCKVGRALTKWGAKLLLLLQNDSLIMYQKLFCILSAPMIFFRLYTGWSKKSL